MAGSVVYLVISQVAAACEGVEQAEPVPDLVNRYIAGVVWIAWGGVPREPRERNHYPIPTGITGVVLGKPRPGNFIWSSPRGAAAYGIKIQCVRTALMQHPLGFILRGQLRLAFGGIHLEPVFVSSPRHARRPEEKLHIRAGACAIKGVVENDNLCVKPGCIHHTIPDSVLDDVEIHRNLKVTQVDDSTDAPNVTYCGINST